MLKKIIMVFKTHFDIGFTDLSSKVLDQYYTTMLKDVIKTCKDTSDMGDLKFIWTMPSWPLYDMLNNVEGEMREELHKLVADGRIVWHALPYTSHTDFSSIEEIISGLRYGRELSERFNIPLKKTAKMTDVPGHGSILPTILNQSGVKFLHLGCNEFATSPDVPLLFQWEGPDSSKLLTMYVSDGYGSAMIPPKDWEYPVWIAFMHTHDNMGPQNADSLKALVKEAKDIFPEAEIVSGTMEDFYNELSQCDLAKLPTIKKDLADTWIHGVGTYPKEVAIVRETRKDTINLEKLNSLYNKDITDQTNKIYDDLNLFSEHTWGLDVKTWLDPNRVYEKRQFEKERLTSKYKYIESSWKEQRARVYNALDNKNAISKNIDKDDNPISVFNPNGESFSGWAEINDELKDLNQLEFFGKSHAFIDKNLEPLSISNYEQSDIENSASQCVSTQGELTIAENHRYQLHFCGKTGEIYKLFDKKLNSILLEKQNGKSVFSYEYNKYGNKIIEQFLSDYGKKWSDWGIKDNGRSDYPIESNEQFKPNFIKWEQQGSNINFYYQGVACEKYGDAKNIRLVVTLPPVGEEVFVEFFLNGKQATPFVESGSLIFPLYEKHPNYRINKNGNEIDPKTDIVKNANHVYYCLENYLAAEGENSGVCIITHDTPLASIGETGVYTFRSEYKENQPQIYFNLFNNMWGTNFPQWMEGDYSFRYTLFGYKSGENIMQTATSLYYGAKILKSQVVDSPVILPKGVRVINFSQKGLDKILRLGDTLGLNRAVGVETKNPELNLQRVDLQGEPISSVYKGKISVDLSPYSIITIKIF